MSDDTVWEYPSDLAKVLKISELTQWLLTVTVTGDQ